MRRGLVDSGDVIPFGLAVGAGVLAAWQVRRLRRRGQRAAMLLTTGALVVGLVVLGAAAWRWPAGRVAYLALVLSFVVATLLVHPPDAED